MNIAEIETLEQRYQTLVGDFQAGKIDETTFVSKVDSLQFQDEAGRYWMLGSQTGAWHYYDGQTWHQADPRDADNLPFVDEQGRYWQQGSTSGDWYYYQPDTGEWVKPDRNDPSIPRSSRRQIEKPGSVPYQSHLRPQSVEAGPDMPSQLDGELFQDDEGRYWMVGAKSGQWYFYDFDGWHPAHEFQHTAAPQPQPYQGQYQYQQTAYAYPAQQQPYQPAQTPPQTQIYAAQPQPPAPQSTQVYAQTQPPAAPQPAHAPVTPSPVPAAQTEAPAAPAPAQPEVSQMPNPPSPKSDTGAWFYFDGKQWLKYSSGEPADVPPPDPEKILDQKAEPAKPKTEPKKTAPSKSDPVVVAELFEEDEEPVVEIVDVEVITVLEAEPDEPESVSVSAPPAASSFAPPAKEDIRPRRVIRSTEQTLPGPTAVDPLRQPRERTTTEPARPLAPRKREVAHEPTIIIPTESAASSIGAARGARPIRPSQPQQRRARENTIPMGAMASAGDWPREVTQPLPAAGSGQGVRPGQAARAEPVARAEQTARPDTAPIKAVRAREATKENVTTSAPTPQPQKTGYTVGDVLRAFPSTVWTLAIGLVVLFIFAVIIVIGLSMLQGNGLGSGGLAVGQSPTPTLSVAIADSTPTPGPTPEITPEPLITSAPPAMIPFNSAVLSFSLDYPEEWYREEMDLQVGFSPSKEGLDPDNLKDAVMWVGQASNQNAAIAEILTDLLARFPAEAETLNQGTISIASQTWTSAQIGFADENLGGQGIATLAVTNREGVGYYLIAIAPANQWNSVQPVFQGMINSFSFAPVETVALAPPANPTNTGEAETTPQPEATSEPTSEPEVPTANATPITYIVQSGDTLLGIAVKFDIDVDLLAAENGIDDPNDLRVGQELIIPFTTEELQTYLAGGGGTGAGASTAGESETGETTPATEEAVASAPGEAGPAGTTPAAPQPTPAADTEAAPVSGKIAYPAFNPAINSYDIWLADVATSEQSVIAGNASQPAFSKDGGAFAYRSWDLSTRGIFFRDFIGGRGGQITHFVEDGQPSWSPDGFSFAFVSRREGDRVPRIYRGDQMGQNDYPIGFQGEYVSTFPDGRLAAKGCLPSGDCGIFIIGPNGGGETKISGEAADTAPAVSPDGGKIAFMSSGRGGTNWEVWVMNADGSNPQRLTENGSNDGLPTWSPDGRSIAYVSDQGGVWAVWAMNADGSNQRKLFNMNGSPDGRVLHAGDDSRGWLEERISWAP
ncbi:MAG: PD40 domain-containing protein [Anaerolineae bacterium]|nr:PD40 domain-containing protein [Anaerolineae bacterium]